MLEAARSSPPNGVRSPRKPAPAPENVTARIRGDDDLIVDYTWAGDRYWFRLDDAQATEPRWLFKIPGLTGDTRHQRSRDCNPKARAHAPVIAQVIAILRRDRLVEAAFTAADARKAKEAADERDLAADYAKSECAGDLYSALKRIVDQSPVPYPWIVEGRATLKACDEKIAAAVAERDAGR